MQYLLTYEHLQTLEGEVMDDVKEGSPLIRQGKLNTVTANTALGKLKGALIGMGALSCCVVV